MKLFIPCTDYVLHQTGLRKPCKLASVIGDSTLSRFRRVACMTLAHLGYDVSLFQSRGNASESQVAVDIAASPQVDLCLALPNGNRLARQTQKTEPKWVLTCCGQIGCALQSVAKEATVFVGDASLSPGVPHAEVYTWLVPLYQAKFFQAGIPLVSQAEGVQLEEDGIHWKQSSHSAVENLIGNMVRAAVNTDAFKYTTPPPLWHWRFNRHYQKHYPTCVICDKECTDQHLNGNVHKALANGTLVSFDFPLREFFCAEGVQFFQGEGRARLVDNSLHLPSDHPMPSQQSSDRPILVFAQSFSVDQHFQELRSPKNSISIHCTMHIGYPGGVAENNIPCTFIASGEAREVFGADDKPIAFKSQRLIAGKDNRNQLEWDIFNSIHSLRQFLPNVYGYFEKDVDGSMVSFLLLEKVSFTFAQLTLKLIDHPPDKFAILLVLRCTERVVNTMVNAARIGIKCHDWHTGNIGFMDNDASFMKLVDWERHRLAVASESYKDRIDKALSCFFRYLPGPHTYNKDNKEFWKDIATKTLEAQTNIADWRNIMTGISETCQSWWNTWKGGAKRDDLPSADQMTALMHNCKQRTFEHMGIIASRQNIVPDPVSTGHFVMPSTTTRVPTVLPAGYYVPAPASTGHTGAAPMAVSIISTPSESSVPTTATAAQTALHRLHGIRQHQIVIETFIHRYGNQWDMQSITTVRDVLLMPVSGLVD